MTFKLAISLTTVTPLSRLIALLVFITLPLIGFYSGINYQIEIDKGKKTTSNISAKSAISPLTKNKIILENLTLIIPENVTDKPSTISATITPSLTEQMTDKGNTTLQIGNSYFKIDGDFDIPIGTKVDKIVKPLNVSIDYTESDLKEYVLQNTLSLYRFDESKKLWIEIPTKIDKDKTIATGELSILGIISLRANAKFPSPKVISVIPKTVKKDTLTSFTVNGENFMPETHSSLCPPFIGDGDGCKEIEYEFISSTMLKFKSTFPIIGKVPLTISNTDSQSFELKEAINVIP